MKTYALSCEQNNTPPPQRPLNAESPQQDPMLKGKRAVIVEDEGMTQMQLRLILRRAGMVVVGAAATGEQGVSICLRERPDVVLMDINMPGKVNGLEASKRILAEYQACIVILTAYTGFKDEAREIGACGFIVKPVDETTLVPQLRNAVARFFRQ